MSERAPSAVLGGLDQLIAETRPEQLPALQTALAARIAAVAARMMNGAGQKAIEAPEENLGIEESARRLGVSEAWLYKNWRRLPFAVRIGRRLLFAARGMEKWNRQRQKTS